MRVTIYETIAESFTLDVPPDVVAQGEDAIAKWVEAERVDGDHLRRFDGVLDVSWEWEED